MHRLLSLGIVFTLACASQQSARPKTIAQPAVEPRLTNSLFFGSSSTAAASIEVLIQNRATVPIMVRRVEVDSPGMSTYTLARATREVRETIAPGQQKIVSIFGTVETLVRNPREPLALRVIVEFQVEEVVWREIVMRR